jgi:aryl-alcohol dehydrogenase-like predicted oxidoreductase
MEFTTLGRTGLRVSRMGLGCGGHSRLGQSHGASEAHSIQVVREAIELGINFIDTAESYRTEAIVGAAMRDTPRDQVVLSTKVGVEKDGTRSAPEEYRSRALACLERLQTDYVDILHIHGLSVEDYPYATRNLVPVLQELRAEGKIRFIGVTEAFASDPGHRMLALASQDDFWDVIMVGLNVLNQSARESVLPWTRANNIGTLLMFAVRRALSDPERLRTLVSELADAGKIDGSEFDMDDPLGFLVADGVASSVTEAAYRFCRWEPGIDVVLSGTGNLDHLRANARYLSQPPLPPEVCDRLRSLFADVDNVSGN